MLQMPLFVFFLEFTKHRIELLETVKVGNINFSQKDYKENGGVHKKSE